MEEGILKVIANKSDWLILSCFILYIAFKLILRYFDQKNEKNTVKGIMKTLMSTIDSINYKLKVISAQYGCELSKESAILIVQNFYLNYANKIADDIYEQQKKGVSHTKIIKNIEDRLVILNNDQKQNLDLFIYRNQYLSTFTKGEIVESDKIIEVINNYSNKNGMLREEIQNLLSIEAGIITTRLN